jgi:hypothetical protein
VLASFDCRQSNQGETNGTEARKWLFRAEVAGPDGKLWLIGNPIYINWDVKNDCNKVPSNSPAR